MLSHGSSTSWEEYSSKSTCPTRRCASTLNTVWTHCWRPWARRGRPCRTSGPSSSAWPQDGPKGQVGEPPHHPLFTFKVLFLFYLLFIYFYFTGVGNELMNYSTVVDTWV